MALRSYSHSSHWGAFDAVVDGETLVDIRPFSGDPNPSPLLQNIRGAIQSPARVTRPMVRAGWLEQGPGSTALRGGDAFVPVAWDEALDLLAGEYRRVYDTYGPEAVYGGSYGWASAGRFHHAQSQLHRFLNGLGGYVSSANTYSNAAGEVILTRVVGTMHGLLHRATAWPVIAEHTDLIVAFGGIPLKNTNVSPGGVTQHNIPGHLQQAIAPPGQSRNDYDIFADLASALGSVEQFSEGRTADEWLPHLYETWRASLPAGTSELPDFAAFWDAGYVRLPDIDADLVMFEEFRQDPTAAPLRTASGRIELFSETIDRFGYEDCIGHPAWYEPEEWLGRAERSFPLVLIANNPRTRLHSQHDPGEYSQASKIQGREPVRLHPDDAFPRGLRDGDVVRIFNERGSCLAGVIVSEDLRPGVVQLSTGAWYDPLDPAEPRSLCVHGNPNVLTFDRGTSRLAQGCSGQHALVEIERWEGPLPPIRAYDPPRMAPRPRISRRDPVTSVNAKD